MNRFIHIRSKYKRHNYKAFLTRFWTDIARLSVRSLVTLVRSVVIT